MEHRSPPPETASDLVRRVEETARRHAMFSMGEKVLVGVSGGPDSMALLHILMALAPRYRLGLAVAHLNHGLRAEASDQDAAFVRQSVRSLNLPFHEEKTRIDAESGSIEEQAREARYAYFRRLMEAHGYGKLALGHQKNDNAEAVLMHLLRGSGIRGLGGIPPVRDQWVVRPLIDIDRSDILAWLKQERIAYVEDASNLDTAYERNRIRHKLIALLAAEYNPNVVDVLHRTADLCREEDAWLNDLLRPMLERAVTASDDNHLEIHLPVMANEPLAVRRRLLREALAKWSGHLRRLTVQHIDSLIGLLPDRQQGKRISLPFGIEAERKTRHLNFTRAAGRGKKPASNSLPYYYKVPEAGNFPLTIDVPECGCCLKFETHLLLPGQEPFQFDTEDRALFDLDALELPLVIRNFQPGDRITPFGMRGTQKIKKIFIDRKIASDQRSRIPLLEGGGDIVWIAGIRRSNKAVLTQNSRRILEVRLVGATPSDTHSKDQTP